MDAVIIANETVEVYRLSKKQVIVFKIDLEKAFDFVDWDLIHKTDTALCDQGEIPIWREVSIISQARKSGTKAGLIPELQQVKSEAVEKQKTLAALK